MTHPTWIGYNLAGRYLIDSELGQGGMSAVYRATDTNLRRVVAIKLIHTHLSKDPEFVRRFEVEATSVAQLRHPHIVQVYDFNKENDTYFIVFEFVPGETLQERLTRNGQAGRLMPIAEVLKIAEGIGTALQYAHDRDIVHRDVKPANVMLNVDGDAILTDFGIVKIVGGPQHTATGAVLGTARYMSPDQIRGQKVDARSDIYSFGVMLYEMVSGEPPFASDSAMTLMMMHMNDPIPDVTLVRADAPPALANIIDKAMAKESEQRYQTMSQLLADLHQVQQDPSPNSPSILPLPIPTPRPTEQQEPDADPTELLATQNRESKQTPPIPTPPSEEIDVDGAELMEADTAVSLPDPTQTAKQQTAPTATIVPTEPPPPPQDNASTAKQGGGKLPFIIIGIVALMVIAILLMMFNPFGEDEAQPVVDVTATVAAVAPTDEVDIVQPIATESIEEDEIDTAVSPTPNNEPTLAPTEAPTIVPTETPIPIPDGMVLIPADTFVMGNNAQRDDEAPEHTVTLSAYFIDQFEVSNAQYQACVTDGACNQNRAGSFTRNDYRDNPEFATYPAVGINWDQAVAFCANAGKRLPTEAEWEYAASGPDKLTWPWGNSFDPNLSAASTPDTQPVDSFADGRSPFDVFNMAGNVTEWVQDNYSTTFYAESDSSQDPLLDDGSNRHVFRGGSFGNTDSDPYRTSRRFNQSATFSDVDIGFRCAQTIP